MRERWKSFLKVRLTVLQKALLSLINGLGSSIYSVQMTVRRFLLLKCISSVYNLLAAVPELVFEKGSPAASVIISRASITFSSSYLFPTSCSEIGASTYLSGSSAHAIECQ
jgi:hypothetical protein